MSLMQVRRQWMAVASERPELQRLEKVDEIGICASFTVDPIVPYLGMKLIEAGRSTPKINLAPYNQIFQVCLDWRSIFKNEPLSALVLLWQIEDLVRTELRQFVRGDSHGLDKALTKVDELCSALKVLRSVFEGDIVVSLPPYPNCFDQDIRMARSYLESKLFHSRIVDRWLSRVQEIGRISILDIDGLQRHVGLLQSFDARKWYLYRQPFSERMWKEIGDSLGWLLAGNRRAAKKCIVVDCDNTLWGGIIGEDGLQGIHLGDDMPGRAYRDFQEQLLTFRSQGVMVALCSKNNEADVWEVFDRHDGMVLKREHIVAYRINWRDKPANILEIAADLNIGIDSVVFIDDSSFEVSMVQNELRTVTCLQVPEDPAMLPKVLSAQRLFDREHISDEDRRRSDMMIQEQDRKELSKGLTPAEFMISLELKAVLFEVGEEHIARVTQLINKTNQFNLTGVRRSQSELTAFCQDSRYDVLALRAADRFGDYGIVAVAILEQDGNTLNVDSLLMSCRVLGRGIEEGLLAIIWEYARKRLCQIIRGQYVPTAKNAMVADLYSKYGFRQDSKNIWTADVSRNFNWPDHLVRSV